MKWLVAALVAGCGAQPEVVFTEPPPAWPDPHAWDRTSRDLLYLTNLGDDTVSVVDAETFEEVDVVPVGLVPVEREGPHHLAATPDGESAFVGISNFVPGSGSGPHGAHGTGDADGYCLKMALDENRVVADVRVDRNPGDVRLMPDGITVLQSHFDLKKMTEFAIDGKDPYDAIARLFVIDGTTMQVDRRVDTCPAPHGIRPSADGREVYLACYGSDEIAVVDMQSGEYEVERIAIGPDASVAPSYYGPYAIMVSPTDGSVWVSCWMNGDLLGEVRRFDPETRTMDTDDLHVLRAQGRAMFGAFSADGSKIYVPFQLSDLLAVFDPATGDPIGSPVALQDTGACFNVHAVELSPDGASLYVVCEGDHPVGSIGNAPGTLLDLDPDTLEMRRFVEVGFNPDDIAIVPAPD